MSFDQTQMYAHLTFFFFKPHCRKAASKVLCERWYFSCISLQMNTEQASFLDEVSTSTVKL